MSYEVTYNEIFKGKSYNMAIIIQPWQVQKIVEEIKKSKANSNIKVKIYLPE